MADYRKVFFAAGLIGVIVFSVPSAMIFVRLPAGERFSELWLLGSNHAAEGYPYNVEENQSYLIYLDVRDDLGSSAYYVVYVKFRNQTQALPDTSAGSPSLLQPLYEYRVFLQDGQSWEQPLTFSFSHLSTAQNQSMVGDLTVNGVALGVDRSEAWSDENKGYFYELFMELWIYDVASDTFQFHNRFVGVWLNVTVAS